MSKQEIIDSGLVKETMDLIPEHTWPLVIDEIAVQIVKTMPAEYIERLTGDRLNFKKAEEILLNFYLQSKEKREDAICDSFGFAGVQTILYALEELELREISPATLSPLWAIA